MINTRYRINGAEILGPNALGSWSPPLFLCVASVPVLTRGVGDDHVYLHWQSNNTLPVSGSTIDTYFLKVRGIFQESVDFHEIKEEELARCNHKLTDLNPDRYHVSLVRISLFTKVEDLANSVSRFWSYKWIIITLCQRFVPQITRIGETMLSFYCAVHPKDDSWVPTINELSPEVMQASLRRVMLMHNAESGGTESDIRGFDIRLSKEPINDFTPHQFLKATKKLLYVINGLAAGTQYYLSIRVHVANLFGYVEGVWSPPMIVSTRAPPTPTIEVSGDDYAVIRWTRKDDPWELQLKYRSAVMNPLSIVFDEFVPFHPDEEIIEPQPLSIFVDREISSFLSMYQQDPSSVSFYDLVYEIPGPTQVRTLTPTGDLMYLVPGQHAKLIISQMRSGIRFKFQVRTKVLNERPGNWSEILYVDTFSDISAVVHEVAESYAMISLIHVTALSDAPTITEKTKLELKLSIIRQDDDEKPNDTRTILMEMPPLLQHFELGNLKLDTPYKFAMRLAEEGRTTTAWSADHVFHTLRQTNSLVRAVTHNTITIMWGCIPPPEIDPTKIRKVDGVGGNIGSQEAGILPSIWELTIKERVKSSEEEYSSSRSEIILVSHPADRYEFVKLKSNTWYSISVRYTDVHGVPSCKSETISVKTLARMEARVTAISEHYAVLLITRHEDEIDDDDIATSCEDMDFDVRCSTFLDDQGEVGDQPSRITVRYHPLYKNFERIVQGLNAGETCFAAIRTKTVWRRELYLPWLGCSEKVEPSWTPWSRPITILTIPPLEIKVLHMTQHQCTVELTRGRPDFSSALTANNFRLLMNRSVQNVEIVLPVGCTTTLTIQGLLGERVYAMSFSNHMEMINSSLWDYWWACVKFRTQAFRPVFPILYEYRGNAVGFFWRSETTEDAAVTQAMAKRQRISQISYQGVTRVSNDVPNLELNPSQLERLQTEDPKCLIEPVTTNDEESEGDLVPPLPTPPPSIASTRSTPDNSFADTAVATSFQKDIETLVYGNTQSLSTKMQYVAENISYFNDDRVPSNNDVPNGKYIVQFTEIGEVDIYSENVLGTIRTLPSAHEWDPVEFGLEYSTHESPDVWVFVGISEKSFTRVLLPPGVILESLCWRTRRRRHGGPWSLPSARISWKPPQPPQVCREFTISMITHNSALLKWDPPYNAPRQNQLIYNIWVQRINTDDKMSILCKCFDTTFALRKLHIGTSYRVGVSAYSTYGHGDRCPARRFTTTHHVSRIVGFNIDQFANEDWDDPIGSLYPHPFEKDCNPPFDHDGGPETFDLSRVPTLPRKKTTAGTVIAKAVTPATGFHMSESLKEVGFRKHSAGEDGDSDVVVNDEETSKMELAFQSSKRLNPSRPILLRHEVPKDNIQWTEEAVPLFAPMPPEHSYISTTRIKKHVHVIEGIVAPTTPPPRDVVTPLEDISDIAAAHTPDYLLTPNDDDSTTVHTNGQPLKELNPIRAAPSPDPSIETTRSTMPSFAPTNTNNTSKPPTPITPTPPPKVNSTIGKSQSGKVTRSFLSIPLNESDLHPIGKSTTSELDMSMSLDASTDAPVVISAKDRYVPLRTARIVCITHELPRPPRTLDFEEEDVEEPDETTIRTRFQPMKKKTRRHVHLPPSPKYQWFSESNKQSYDHITNCMRRKRNVPAVFDVKKEIEKMFES
eukprot:PhF_6_TR36325/c0_g1_i4/m.53166